MSKEDTSVANMCMYTTDVMYCITAIDDDKDFCPAHIVPSYGVVPNYETMLKKRIQSLNDSMDKYELGFLYPKIMMPDKKFTCHCVYTLVKMNLMCLSDNELNNRLSEFFLKIGYPDTHSQLCVMASKLHERRTSEREKKNKVETEENESIVTTDDKVTLHV